MTRRGDVIADMIVLLSHTFGNVQDKSKNLSEIVKTIDPNVGEIKTEVMTLKTTNSIPMKVNDLLTVEMLQERNGGTSDDIKNRIMKARNTFLSV